MFSSSNTTHSLSQQVAQLRPHARTSHHREMASGIAVEEDHDVEGEGYDDEGFEEDDDDDDAEGLRSRALPADGEPDYDAGPPVDGLEYLRRVRHEASKVTKLGVSSAVNLLFLSPKP